METLLEAIARLRMLGYRLDFAAAPGGRLHCGGRAEDLDAAALTVDETVRFEGASDPDGEAILSRFPAPMDTGGSIAQPSERRRPQMMSMFSTCSCDAEQARTIRRETEVIHA